MSWLKKIKLCSKYVLILPVSLMLYSCAGHKPDLNLPTMQPAPPPQAKKPNVVVVLGSGGARGYAHLGVLQALHHAHIPINAIVCASAGCIVGALYSDNQNPKKTYHIMMKAGFWDFADISNLPDMSGVMEGYHLEKFLIKNMHAQNFSQLKSRLLVATTDLKTGKPYLIQGGPVAPAILASSALPGVVQPVHLYGHVLIDGGVASPVPTQFAKTLDPKVIIAVNIAEQLKPGVPVAAYNIYKRAYNIMWQRQTDASLDEANIIIRPKLGQIGTFDLSQKYQLYLAGLRAGNKMVPKILKLLKKDHIPLTPKS